MTEFSDGPSGEVGRPAGPPEGAPPDPYQPGPYPPGPPPFPGFPLAPAAPRNGLGVASLVLGILALLAMWTLFGNVALGIIAVVFGATARGRVRRGEATNGGVATAGIVLGIIAAVAPIVILVALALGTDLLNGDYQHCIGYHRGDEQACDQYR
jgi:hypothetical protein